MKRIPSKVNPAGHQRFCLTLAGAGLACITALQAGPGPISMDWQKISGGGGTSTNSRFVISGTIGQTDAGGLMSGGRFAMGGGFWSLYAVQTPGAPVLRFLPVEYSTTYHTNFLSGPNFGKVSTNSIPTAMQLSWPSGPLSYTVQTNGDLLNSSGWADYAVPTQDNGSVKTLLISLPAGNQLPQQLYFRLRR